MIGREACERQERACGAMSCLLRRSPSSQGVRMLIIGMGIQHPQPYACTSIWHCCLDARAVAQLREPEGYRANQRPTRDCSTRVPSTASRYTCTGALCIVVHAKEGGCES